MQKTCYICKEVKPLEDFQNKASSKDGKHNYCRLCTKKKNKEWLENNKDKHKLSCANWYKNNKEKSNLSSSKWHYKNNYGISYETFLQMCKDLDYKCTIWFREIEVGRKGINSAVLDHCHTTGKIRGILCHGCNAGIGFMQENLNVLERAKLYLKGELPSENTFIRY